VLQSWRDIQALAVAHFCVNSITVILAQRGKQASREAAARKARIQIAISAEGQE
jgi:hypothetical protein